MKTINELIELYQQAVEYHNGKNDGKYQYYETRMQNLFVRPDVIMRMKQASANPEQVKKQEEEQQKKRNAMSKDQLMQEEHKQKLEHKKLLAAQLQANTKIAQEVTLQKLPQFKEMEEQELKREQDYQQAKQIILSDIQTQGQGISEKVAKRRQDRMFKLVQLQLPQRNRIGTTKFAPSKKFFDPMNTSSDDKNVPNQFLIEDQNISEIIGLNDTSNILDNSMQRNLFHNPQISIVEELDSESQEDAYHEAIKQIIATSEQELLKIAQEQEAETNEIFETVTNQKFERVAEIKADYDFKLKRLVGEKFQQKYNETKIAKEDALVQCKLEMEKIKREKLDAVKVKYDLQRKQISADKELSMNAAKAQYKQAKTTSNSIIMSRLSGQFQNQLSRKIFKMPEQSFQDDEEETNLNDDVQIKLPNKDDSTRTD